MKIWLINNYNMLPEHGHLNRNYYLAKYLKKLGHEPIVFVGSHPHNSSLQLIEGKVKFKIYREEPYPWVLIKTRNYEGSKKSRVISMVEFYRNMQEAAKHFEKPDAIIGSSAHPLAALSAIRLGNRFGCKSIMEVRDLWPESIVTYGVLPRNNPIIRLLYKFEKYLYAHADALIFTMENAWQYFEEQGLDKVIPREKVNYINNGVDLEEYKQNLAQNPYHDVDLDREGTFKVVYTGSIRKVNNIGLLLDAAKLVNNSNVQFLIWGAGDEVESLKARCQNERIRNVVFKGSVEKKYIASITSKADLNLMHGSQSPVLKYGLSANKLFDYAAAGKPILTDFMSGNNPADRFGAGVTVANPSPIRIAEAIDKMADLDEVVYDQYCENAEKLSIAYSYENLARKMVSIIKNN